VDIAVLVVALIATVLAGTALARRLNVPPPLLLLALGTAIGYIPGVPAIPLDPDLVLIGLLPPLLYAASIRTSFVDIRANKTSITFLAVTLVVITTLVVGWAASALLDVPFAVGCALGAVVSPPDAVAATAVGRTIGLPRRVVTVLEGESLLNDASALVALRTAIAATAGVVSVWSMAGTFLYAVVAAIAVGIAVGKVAAWIRRKITDPLLDTSLSFLIPFLAFIPAEELHASGVLAVVVAGLVLGHKAPAMQTASQRVVERMTWGSIQFLLEHLVFLLIGLQAKWVNDEVLASGLGAGRVLFVAGLVLLIVMIVRPAMVFTARAPLLRRATDRSGGSWQEALVLSWAGMRGVVTLAAVLGLPAETPERPAIVMIALVVTAGTLILQGLTLPAVARLLHVRGPDPREDALQMATIMQRATTVGLAEVSAAAGENEAEAMETLRSQAEARTFAAWERLGRSHEDLETPSEIFRRLRLSMIDVMRREVLAMRSEGKADHEVMSDLLAGLDVEEATLENSQERLAAVKETPLTTPAPLTGACEHLRDAPTCVTPRTPEACSRCVEEGLTWVHLRLCLTCGTVACCDSSPGRHATAHYGDTHHPVIRSFEPGEHWRWCYVDDQLG
jgi:monovalent cation/hydrogen antiporter